MKMRINYDLPMFSRVLIDKTEFSILPFSPPNEHESFMKTVDEIILIHFSLFLFMFMFVCLFFFVERSRSDLCNSISLESISRYYKMSNFRLSC